MEAQGIVNRQRTKTWGSVAETSDKSDVSEESSKIEQTVNTLMDKVETLQNTKVWTGTQRCPT